jgi:hypothetical protein
MVWGGGGSRLAEGRPPLGHTLLHARGRQWALNWAAYGRDPQLVMSRPKQLNKSFINQPIKKFLSHSVYVYLT